MGTTVSNLGALVKDGSTKTERVQCSKCSQWTAHEFKVADADLLVKALNALSAAAPRLKTKDDAASAKAVKYIVDLSEMSSTEIAERIAELEAQIAGEA